jgi:hypothetical protein
MLKETHLRYVRHRDVLDYARLGWLPDFDALDGTHHGQYSIIMEWRCQCPILEPKKC